MTETKYFRYPTRGVQKNKTEQYIIGWDQAKNWAFLRIQIKGFFKAGPKGGLKVRNRGQINLPGINLAANAAVQEAQKEAIWTAWNKIKSDVEDFLTYPPEFEVDLDV